LAKVSLYIDDGAWKRFREQVFARHGTLRKLSGEVEGLIYSEDIERILAMGAEKVGIPIERELTPSVIKKARPKLRGEVAERIVRQMRDQRHAGRVPR
jgi:Holliday junction resolvasome RuvABC ATP-dependent DNA helicase subunit